MNNGGINDIFVIFVKNTNNPITKGATANDIINFSTLIFFISALIFFHSMIMIIIVKTIPVIKSALRDENRIIASGRSVPSSPISMFEFLAKYYAPNITVKTALNKKAIPK